jgi:hypothetical protein
VSPTSRRNVGPGISPAPEQAVTDVHDAKVCALTIFPFPMSTTDSSATSVVSMFADGSVSAIVGGAA